MNDFLHRIAALILPSDFPLWDKKILFENFLSVSLFQLMTLFIPFITIPYLVRVLGPEKFGLIAFGQAFIQYFVMLIDYGFNLSAAREISIHKAAINRISDILSAVLIIKIFLALTSLIVFLVLIANIPRLRADSLFYLLNFGSVLGAAFFCGFFFMGMEKMKYLFYLNLVALGSVAAIFLFVRSEGHLLRVPLIGSVSSCVMGFLSLWTAHRKFKVQFLRFNLKEIRHQLQDGWHAFLSNFSIAGYMNMRVLALGMLTSHLITGYYALAEKLMNILLLFPLSISMQVFYPRLSQMFTQNESAAIRLVKHLQAGTNWLYLVLLSACFIFAPFLMRLLSGYPYPEAVLSLRILLVATFFIAANAYRLHFLMVSGKSAVFAKIHILASLAGTVLAILFTYRFSYPGTAASIIVTALLALAFTSKFPSPCQIHEDAKSDS